MASFSPNKSVAAASIEQPCGAELTSTGSGGDEVEELGEEGEKDEEEDEDEDEDEEEGEGREEEEDEDEEDEDEEAALQKHLEKSLSKLEAARERFFSETRHYIYKGTKGDYIIRGDCNENVSTDAMQYGWPQAFVGGEPQPVNAAMWIKQESSGEYLLVSVWTFSPTGDETNVYLLDGAGYADDVFAACGYGYSDINKEVITDADVRHAFSVSSGDNVEEALHCPVLDNIAIAKMEEYNTKTPKTNRTLKDACRAHGAGTMCMYCRHRKKSRKA